MSELTAHEVLVKARNLIADEDRWGRDDEVLCGDRLCLGMALDRACPDLSAAHREAELALVHEIGAGNHPFAVIDFNDSHPHVAVLALADRAIAATAPEPDVSFVTEPVEAVA